MINRKKKICVDCQKDQYIFSKGRCFFCAKKNYKPILKVRKPTGELALFKALWEIRKRICTNCKIPLKQFSPSYFSHIKSKGAYPELRLDPSNIQLLCFTCHRLYDQGTKDQFNKRFKQ